MKSFNKVVLMGRITRDPELKQTPSGQTVCNFSVALNRSYKKDDEWVENTDFVDVVAWGPLAERVSTRAVKGTNVLVEGELRSRSWEGDDGQTRLKMEVHAHDVIATEKVEEQ